MTAKRSGGSSTSSRKTKKAAPKRSRLLQTGLVEELVNIGPGARLRLRGPKSAGKSLRATISEVEAIPEFHIGRNWVRLIEEKVETPASAISIEPLLPDATAPAVFKRASSRLMAEALLDMSNTRLAPVVMPTVSDLKEMSARSIHSMDPRLQLAVTNHRAGKRGIGMASTTEDEISVVARVTDSAAWRATPDVFPGVTIDGAEDGTSIVTGRIPVNRIEAVRTMPFVVSMKASQSLRPALEDTMRVMALSPQALPAGKLPGGAKGVVVGIVDFGCDFAHQNFRHSNGRTRIQALWHQAGSTSPTSPFGYGKVYRTGDIDAALKSNAPYKALGYGPQSVSGWNSGTHGTHVMDIAAGNGLGSGQAGAAPQADLIFVEAACTDVAWGSPEVVDNSFGDSIQLLEAVRFIFDEAGDRPCVVNLSLGTNGGPHDGSSLVEQGLDSLVRERPNRAVVIAASNSQQDGIHTSGKVRPESAHDIVWRTTPSGGGEFELWCSGKSSLAVTLIAPDGTAFGPVQPDDQLSLGDKGQVAILIANRKRDPNNRDNMIGIYMAEGVPGGDWTVRLNLVDGEAVDYHAWIERDDSNQSSFANPVPTHTIGSISTGMETIVVGSYDAKSTNFPLSTFSSAGPTRDGREKPEISAPGQHVFAARSGTGTGVIRKSGTSMAAPAVAGLIALMLAEAHRSGQALSIGQIRANLVNHALTMSPTGNQTWHERYGFGRANSASI